MYLLQPDNESFWNTLFNAITQCGESVFWTLLIGIAGTLIAQKIINWWTAEDADRYGEISYKDSNSEIKVKYTGDEWSFPDLSMFDGTTGAQNNDSDEETG